MNQCHIGITQHLAHESLFVSPWEMFGKFCLNRGNQILFRVGKPTEASMGRWWDDCPQEEWMTNHRSFEVFFQIPEIRHEARTSLGIDQKVRCTCEKPLKNDIINHVEKAWSFGGLSQIIHQPPCLAARLFSGNPKNGFGVLFGVTSKKGTHPQKKTTKPHRWFPFGVPKD